MKLIFVTQRIDEAVSYAERRDALDQRWAVLLEKLGCAALPVPNHPKTAAALLERVRPDGILLTGGNNPASCGGNAPERDETDARLIEYSLDRSVPLFGVCRGMQSSLVYFGGALERISGHVAVCHDVSGAISRTVNSYHNWGARQTPSKLEVLARAADGVVEAISVKGWPIAGIMWHPERVSPFAQDDIRLMKAVFEQGDSL